MIVVRPDTPPKLAYTATQLAEQLRAGKERVRMRLYTANGKRSNVYASFRAAGQSIKVSFKVRRGDTFAVFPALVRSSATPNRTHIRLKHHAMRPLVAEWDRLRQIVERHNFKLPKYSASGGARTPGGGGTSGGRAASPGKENRSPQRGRA